MSKYNPGPDSKKVPREALESVRRALAETDRTMVSTKSLDHGVGPRIAGRALRVMQSEGYLELYNDGQKRRVYRVVESPEADA